MREKNQNDFYCTVGTQFFFNIWDGCMLNYYRYRISKFTNTVKFDTMDPSSAEPVLQTPYKFSHRWIQ